MVCYFWSHISSHSTRAICLLFLLSRWMKGVQGSNALTRRGVPLWVSRSFFPDSLVVLVLVFWYFWCRHINATIFKINQGRIFCLRFGIVVPFFWHIERFFCIFMSPETPYAPTPRRRLRAPWSAPPRYAPSRSPAASFAHPAVGCFY